MYIFIILYPTAILQWATAFSCKKFCFLEHCHSVYQKSGGGEGGGEEALWPRKEMHCMNDAQSPESKTSLFYLYL